MEWMPIETAPKHEYCLVYVPQPHWFYEPEPFVFQAWWGGDRWMITTDGNGAWVKPTHWMPLPSPPQTQAQAPQP